MKRISILSYLIILSFFLFPVLANAGSATIQWRANTDPDLAGYRIYWSSNAGGPYGSSTGLITGTTNYTITDLAPGTYYFVVTAIDTSGNESAYSIEATKSIVETPSDTQAPTVAITSYPSTTSGSSIDISGTASDNISVAKVTWANLSTGGSGTATGANSWSIKGIALQMGANQIRVSAADTSGQQGTETITVTRMDTQAPTVAIISPTSANSYETNISYLDLSGSASDNAGVSQVTWANAGGGSGTASGADNWSISGISLVIGENVITVTARDNAGNQGSSTLMVNYIPPGDITPPTVTITSPTKKDSYKTRDSSVDLEGSASDNLGVIRVSWSNQSTGEGGIASGLDSWSVLGISLANGENTITVMAVDEAGNIGTALLSVVRQGGGRK